MVCQIGKLHGLKVIAIAGSDDKCAWLENELGVDKALNYKSPTFVEDMGKTGYLDVMFDNVGGDILDFCLTRLNKGARIVLSGKSSWELETIKYLTHKSSQVESHSTVCRNPRL